MTNSPSREIMLAWREIYDSQTCIFLYEWTDVIWGLYMYIEQLPTFVLLFHLEKMNFWMFIFLEWTIMIVNLFLETFIPWSQLYFTK